MENKEKIFGNLFGTIDLYNEEHLEMILSSMDKEHAIYYLVEAVKCAFNRGTYTIGESEVISKSIRNLSRNNSVSE